MPIKLENINIGGVANSDIQGSENSVSECVNLDIHNKVGFIRLNHRMTKISTETLDVDIYFIVSASNGKKYFFGKTTGKIYEYDGTTFTLKYTDLHANLYGAIQFNGYVYWATQSYLQRIPVANLSDTWSSYIENEWGTFSNGSNEHPLYSLNQVLYIGDGNYVALVEDGVFGAEGLDLPENETILTLGENLGNELVIGSIVGSNSDANAGYGYMRRWNTWSNSFTSEDITKSGAVRTILDVDNETVVLVGERGDMAKYSGDILQNIKTIKGDFDKDGLYSNHNGVANLRGLALFGLYNGTPNLNGIWSYGSIFAGYPKVLSCEFLLSNGETSGFTNMYLAKGRDNIYVSWKHYNSITVTTTYGIDKYDITKYQDSGYFTTRIIKNDRDEFKKYKKVKVGYSSLPTGTSIEIWKSINYGAFEKMETTQDTDRKILESSVDVSDATTLQVRIVLKTNTAKTATPEMESLYIGL